MESKLNKTALMTKRSLQHKKPLSVGDMIFYQKVSAEALNALKDDLEKAYSLDIDSPGVLDKLNALEKRMKLNDLFQTSFRKLKKGMESDFETLLWIKGLKDDEKQLYLEKTREREIISHKQPIPSIFEAFGIPKPVGFNQRLREIEERVIADWQEREDWYNLYKFFKERNPDRARDFKDLWEEQKKAGKEPKPEKTGLPDYLKDK